MARQVQIPNPGGEMVLFWDEDGEDEYFVHSQVFNEDQAAAAGGGLFMNQGNLDGMGVGGPFFRNPLG